MRTRFWTFLSFGGLSFVGLVFLASACSTKEIRKYTYPPDFRYLEEKELSTSMWKLAVAVADLNSYFEMEKGPDSTEQGEIVLILKEMESISLRLNGKGLSNHPFMDQKLGIFRAQLEKARRSAEKTPPNFYDAGKVAGGCANCHVVGP